MVVIHRAYGFRFVIYTQDHDPAHIHITGAGQAKINLLGPGGRPKLVFSIGIKRSDMRRLLEDVVLKQAVFLKEWDRIHGKAD